MSNSSNRYFPGQSRNRMDKVREAVEQNWEVVTLEKSYPDMNSYVLKDWLTDMNLEQNVDYVYVDVVDSNAQFALKSNGLYVAMVAFKDSAIAALFKLAMA